MVSGLARRYGELEALHELELEVGEGECVAVIGHNGSGKTTAVRVIAGLLDPSAGSVVIDDARLGTVSDGVINRGALGMVPDNAFAVRRSDRPRALAAGRDRPRRR